MIETFQRALPHGITLSCRAAGERGRPLMVFLHGFPEAAFIWDELLEHFAQPEHGGYRCVAPNLRGFEKSSSPTEVDGLPAHLLVQDIAAARARASATTAASTRWSRTTGAAPSAGAWATSMPERSAGW